MIDATGRKKPARPQSPRNIGFVFSALLAISAVFSAGCGKKGPPLAPLIKLPVPPPDLTASRRGDSVELSFTVPATNTDGSRPANVARADVYAITAPVGVPPLSDASLLKYGTKVGEVEVKAPRDPNLTADEDEPNDEVDPPEGKGLDQGTLARLREPLTSEMLTPAIVPPDKNAPPPLPVADPTSGPLLGAPAAVPLRTYVVFGQSARGRKGPLSKRVTVPLVPPPPPVARVAIAYDEKAITVTWPPARTAVAASSGDLLPARVIGVTRPVITYNVYDSTNADAPIKLTAKPLDEPTFADTRVVFGEKRCYTVVSAESIGGTTIESTAGSAACDTLTDTFPPVAPKGLNAISSEGAITLIWEPNTEKDLAGYIVLRGVEPAETLLPITPAPIAEPSFKDDVKPGVSYVYAVRAVDKAGNSGPISARVVETAR